MQCDRNFFPTSLLTLNQKWLPCTHHTSWWHASFLYRQSRKYTHTEEDLKNLHETKRLKNCLLSVLSTLNFSVLQLSLSLIPLYNALCVNTLLFTSWQTVGCATPGSPSHIPSHPAIGQKVLVLSTATSVIEHTVYWK